MKKTFIALAVLLISLSTQGQGYKPESEAIDFELKNVDGKMVSLKDFKMAKGFIVIFTTNHCPYSIAYEDRIIALNNKYQAQGYPVIAINPNDPISYPDDSFENMQKRAKEKSFTFPYLLDETQQIAKTYGATRTPHVYVLLKSGKQLIVKYIGAIDDNYQDATAVKEKYLENALIELIAEKSPTVAETKAIGCTIKWKK